MSAASSTTARPALPLPRTPLVGRERELAAVARSFSATTFAW